MPSCGSALKPEKLPPQACGPHSRTWPATTAPASSSYAVGRPAVVGDRGADDEGGVGDPAGDHDVGALAQGGGDAEAAEVGVGGERAVEAEVGGAAPQVVALDVGDRGVEAEAAGDLAQPVGQPGRVEAAGVADDRDAPLERQAEAVLELADEGARVAERGVLHRVLAEDQHGQLGEVVAGEAVEALPVGGALEHLAHRREAVAVEAGAVADAEGPRGSLRAHLSHRSPRVPRPGGPAKHWAMPSQCSASSPVATRSVSSRCTRWVTSRQKSWARPGDPLGGVVGSPGPGLARRRGQLDAELLGAAASRRARRRRSRGCGRRGGRRAGSGRWARSSTPRAS